MYDFITIHIFTTIDNPIKGWFYMFVSLLFVCLQGKNSHLKRYLHSKVLQLFCSSQPWRPSTDDYNILLMMKCEYVSSKWILYIYKTVCTVNSWWCKLSPGHIVQEAEVVSRPALLCWWGPSGSWSEGHGPFPARSTLAPNHGRWCAEHISPESTPP